MRTDQTEPHAAFPCSIFFDDVDDLRVRGLDHRLERNAQRAYVGTEDRDIGFFVDCEAGGTLIEGDVDFGGGLRTSNGMRDVFVVAFDQDGDYIWDRTFGGADDEAPGGIATDADAHVVIAGSFQASADFGGGVRTSNGEADAFVVMLRD